MCLAMAPKQTYKHSIFELYQDKRFKEILKIYLIKLQPTKLEGIPDPWLFEVAPGKHCTHVSIEDVHRAGA